MNISELWREIKKGKGNLKMMWQPQETEADTIQYTCTGWWVVKHAPHSTLFYSSWCQGQINMDSPLWDCSIVEQCILVSLWVEGVKLAEIHYRMLAQYESENHMTSWKVYE